MFVATGLWAAGAAGAAAPEREMIANLWGEMAEKPEYGGVQLPHRSGVQPGAAVAGGEDFALQIARNRYPRRHAGKYKRKRRRHRHDSGRSGARRQDVNGIFADHFVGRDQRQPKRLRLRNQEPVERIAMQHRECFDQLGVLPADR